MKQIAVIGTHKSYTAFINMISGFDSDKFFHADSEDKLRGRKLLDVICLHDYPLVENAELIERLAVTRLRPTNDN